MAADCGRKTGFGKGARRLALTLTGSREEVA